MRVRVRCWTVLEVLSLLSRRKIFQLQWKISYLQPPQDEEGPEGGSGSELWQRFRISRAVRKFPEENVSLYVSRILPHRATHCYFCLHRWDGLRLEIVYIYLSKVTSWATDVPSPPVEKPLSQNTFLTRLRPTSPPSTRGTPSSCQTGAKFLSQGQSLLVWVKL